MPSEFVQGGNPSGTFRVLVVDDASPDDTVEVARSLGAEVLSP